MDERTIIELSELDQIMPRLYIRWLLCFRLSQASPSKDTIIETLQTGIESTLEALPILRGAVVPKPSDPSRLEVHVPRKTSKFGPRVQHREEFFPTYDILERAEFPVSLLPDEILTPPDIDSKPVFEMMATFIRGGLLLCIKCHHAVTDGAGLGLIVKLLARNCLESSSPIASPELNRAPSTDRSLLPQATDEFDDATNIGFEVVDPTPKPDATPTREYASMIHHTFKFSPDALKTLKGLCTIDSRVISTQDALTSLLYGAVSYARAARFTRESTDHRTLPSVLGIAVNARGRIPDAPAYAGNATLYAAFSHPMRLPVGEIPSDSLQDTTLLAERLGLPSLASQSRAAITAVTHGSLVATIAAAAAQRDASRLQPAFSDFYQGTDFFITSGADFPVFEQEWWTGGIVDALRIPLKGQWDGSSAVLATKDRDAGLDVLLGMREDDMALVKGLLFAFGARVV
ncbi:uncharacterized protein L3040_002829 [Drepanopeziza brunnea f. sp. 'multigermtubi']|uniref:Trichothecene 3-O-acetyltransferase-like N-terminal domain-containing protein n=1 Tax=Marssonina brunnea f. sp. multigermtubi (strain MB_m1) TaxID=1072389 RepID=K1WBN0_MARBU|nr:uncharacterized protein MBM_06956 [Drepanopeziza brunnea f. sp. 'multigermtubi' MB_m1]EKD14745.1 hypothetical protein MBM_06956 [Drepanopeziza brunnea f. sp. 'multigermtubi' MB_m1]KAJ5050962.1 hypothetical protein L3040_002829 [Drepanopeziza brunnea f. sp. 'multigermtubi']